MNRLTLVATLAIALSLVFPASLSCASSLPGNSGAPAASSGGEWQSLVQAGQADKQLVIFSGSIGAGKDAIIKDFGSKYGIQVDVIQGRGTEIAQKMERERQAGIYSGDIGIQGPTTFFGQIKPMNVALPLEPWFILPEVKDASKWRNGRLPFIDSAKTAIAPVATIVPFVLINTDMVKDNEIGSYLDLLNPKWKGKAVINDPSVPGNGPEWFAFTMLVAFGNQQKGEEFMTKLVAQEPIVLRDQRLMVEWVARGKNPVGLAFDQAEVMKMIATGAPIKFIRVKEGSTFTPGPGIFTVLDKAPHPAAARMFLNWALSKEGAASISPSFGYPSQRVDVSNSSFDPIFLPQKDDALSGEDWEAQKTVMMKVAAGMFKNLTQ